LNRNYVEENKKKYNNWKEIVKLNGR
jgi:hypothetical protein